MNIKEELLREHSKAQAVRIAGYIGNDEARFRELMDLFFEGAYRVNQRGVWVIRHCYDRHPELIAPYLPRMVEVLDGDAHDAIKRNITFIFSTFYLPDELLGPIADICFGYLTSANEAIAIKVHSMTTLTVIAEREPDLANEIKLIIEEQMPYGSAGFKSRGKKMLKRLNKLIDQP